MMKKKILIAGATGMLGSKIADYLLQQGAEVIAIVRESSKTEKISQLKYSGATIIPLQMEDRLALQRACEGVSCVISAVAGLGETIIDFQSRLLDAAIAAKVPRFIPSDFSTDFTQMDKGFNRNFDLRKEFKVYLDQQPIQSTSIFNGAFAYLLNYNLPLFNVKEGRVLFYGEKQDFSIDFTTVEDTAQYTAKVALDDKTPRNLNIASFSPSPKDFGAIGKQFFDKDFELINGGSLEDFATVIQEKRKANPKSEQELYADWQQMQYLHSMFLVHHLELNNNRYQDLQWASMAQVIKK
ncbi:NmrA family NAD(P)-binding protein [Zunongwangia endophytica]|uniref:NmrA family NAD(P)-binding protein n=1 Tax=Zunongwangia endophytica TaxID=1808945 RepID=A0ABV8H497_9FLAO|nr:NmrA family NAD(P)-binding protein [Zunongwangia endophytica]MDN3594408.1 NmrA family NAD(P)-binding protein [Zunongwangia endophytica]